MRAASYGLAPDVTVGGYANRANVWLVLQYLRTHPYLPTFTLKCCFIFFHPFAQITALPCGNFISVLFLCSNVIPTLRRRFSLSPSIFFFSTIFLPVFDLTKMNTTLGWSKNLNTGINESEGRGGNLWGSHNVYDTVWEYGTLKFRHIYDEGKGFLNY